MSIFDEYSKEYECLMKNIIDGLPVVNESASPTAVQNIATICNQVEGLIKQMKIEANSSESTARKLCCDKICQYEQRLSAARVELQKYSKIALVGTGKSSEQKQRLLNANEKVEVHSIVILAAQRSVEESILVGTEIANNLIEIKEKIKSAHSKVTDLGDDLTLAEKQIKGMQSREKCTIS